MGTPDLCNLNEELFVVIELGDGLLLYWTTDPGTLNRTSCDSATVFDERLFESPESCRLVFCADVEIILADVHTTSAVQTLRVHAAHTVNIDSDPMFFTTPRLTSGVSASSWVGRPRLNLSFSWLVARHLRLNLSDVVSGRKSWCSGRGRVALRYHVDTPCGARNFSRVLSARETSHPQPPVERAPVCCGCPCRDPLGDDSSRVMSHQSANSVRAAVLSCVVLS